MAPKSKSSSGPVLKQGTLSFASAKRGSTAAGKANTLKASPPVSSVKPHGGEKREPSSRTASISSTVNASSSTDSNTDDDIVLVTPTVEQRSSKRRKTANGQPKNVYKAAGAVRKAATNDSDTSSDEEEQVDLKVLEKNPRIQRLYNQTRTRMGDVPPVHAEKQTKIHHILRVFDTSYEYGPCIGMTRLQRWERAHALGLNPPPEVREILLSKQGLEEDEFKQCVFYDDI
ncbi:hypothetical protein A7U60_g5181 [Sanghuangporus baumii]|uniref:DNA polymerase delta subunit 4 n=1 Tax=Sanghuangporus baumii TaxID=108892 RepID=A0A9Q5HX55_SANBA|nr:hypothetical protein A7U60_g5181 [Sanghuangporus baumii]